MTDMEKSPRSADGRAGDSKSPGRRFDPGRGRQLTYHDEIQPFTDFSNAAIVIMAALVIIYCIFR